MKKIISLGTVLALAVTSSGIAVNADAEKPVVWTASANASPDADFSALTDGDEATVFETKPLGAAKTIRLFFDRGEDAQTFTTVRVGFTQYNASKLSIYTSDTVYNVLGTTVAAPPEESGISSVRFNNATYQRPLTVLNLSPYHIGEAGTDYPKEINLSFEQCADRYVCVEITTAYDASGSGEYSGINNIISGIDISQSAPASISLQAEQTSVSVPVIDGETKTVAITAQVLDDSGFKIEDKALNGVEFALAEEYEGITLSEDGVLSISQDAAAGTEVTVTARLTAEGYTDITSEIIITITEADRVERAIGEAITALTYSMISSQSIDSTGKNLSLLYDKDGVLTIGDTAYDGLSISWSSSNTDVISDTGAVTRPDGGANVKVTLTATISGYNDEGEYRFAEKKFEITVIREGELVDMRNLCKGGYAWVNSGWGSPWNACDGDRATYWSLGNHTQSSITAGFKFASGELEKYNKIVLTFWGSDDKIASCGVTGYRTFVNDPGENSSARFDGGSGPTEIYALDWSNPDTVPDPETRQVIINMSKPSQSAGLAVTLGNTADSSNNNTGIYEVEAYYATPYKVELADPNQKLFVPLEGEPDAEYDMPEFTVYDEAGDVLVSEFESSVSLAHPYAGVEIRDGKIIIGSSCETGSIELLYSSWDSDKVYLNEVVEVPVVKYTQEYRDILTDIASVTIPATAETDLNLPLSGANGSQITWSSSDESIITSDGKLTRPKYPADDAVVVLKAVYQKGEYSVEREYEVTVIRDMTDEQRVLLDANKIDLNLPPGGTVSSDIVLPDTGYYGSKITWHSSNSKIISDTGAYTQRSGTSSVTVVTLTATVTYNGYTETKEFKIYAATKVTASGGGGGGGGGGSGGGGGGSAGGIYTGADALQPVQSEKTAPPVPLTEDELTQGHFGDVPNDHWAFDYIEKLTERKIISGVSDDTFEPERAITREEFVKLIVTAFGYNLKPDAANFEDVASDEWFADYVSTAYSEGIVSGVTDTLFGVGENITRQDMMVIIARVLEKADVDFMGVEPEFTDIEDAADYARDAVTKLSKIGIISGDEDNRLLPGENATRAEAAKMLYEAMSKGGLIK